MDHSNEPRRRSFRWAGIATVVFALPFALAAASAGPENEAGTATLRGTYSAARVVGPQRCSECHEPETLVWKDSMHYKGSKMLTRSSEAKAIAEALGVRRVKSDERCASCHFTQQELPGKRLRSIAGVSCESCHGSGRDWLDLHADLGPEQRASGLEDPAHRSARITACDEAGIVRSGRLFSMATSCHRCHTITDRELIEVGGHPTGAGFEFVAWSQGGMRHNFVRSNENPTSSRERMRLMFISGHLAALGQAMRGEMADRIDAERAALEELLVVIEDDGLRAIFEFSETNTGAAAAGHLSELAEQWERRADGGDLEAVDAFLPRKEDYR